MAGDGGYFRYGHQLSFTGSDGAGDTSETGRSAELGWKQPRTCGSENHYYDK